MCVISNTGFIESSSPFCMNELLLMMLTHEKSEPLQRTGEKPGSTKSPINSSANSDHNLHSKAQQLEIVTHLSLQALPARGSLKTEQHLGDNSVIPDYTLMHCCCVVTVRFSTLCPPRLSQQKWLSPVNECHGECSPCVSAEKGLFTKKAAILTRSLSCYSGKSKCTAHKQGLTKCLFLKFLVIWGTKVCITGVPKASEVFTGPYTSDNPTLCPKNWVLNWNCKCIFVGKINATTLRFLLT